MGVSPMPIYVGASEKFSFSPDLILKTVEFDAFDDQHICPVQTALSISTTQHLYGPTHGHPHFRPFARNHAQIFGYALGLLISPSPVLFLTILLAGIVHLIVLPMIWPASVLQEAEAQIKATETLLHDECARRRNVAMANIYARGLARLNALQTDVDRLSHHHRTLFRCCRVHQYLRIVYSLSRNSQRCLRDVKDHRVDLEQEIRALDHAGFLAHNEGGPRSADSSLLVNNQV